MIRVLGTWQRVRVFTLLQKNCTENRAMAAAAEDGFEVKAESAVVASQISAEDKTRLDGEAPIREYLQQKYEKEAKRNWDIFYKRNTTNFFKDRHWLARYAKQVLYRLMCLDTPPCSLQSSAHSRKELCSRLFPSPRANDSLHICNNKPAGTRARSFPTCRLETPQPSGAL